MDNKTIAQKIARIAYKPKSEQSDDFAVQLLAEKISIPHGTDGYTEEDIERGILNILEQMESSKEVS